MSSVHQGQRPPAHRSSLHEEVDLAIQTFVSSVKNRDIAAICKAIEGLLSLTEDQTIDSNEWRIRLRQQQHLMVRLLLMSFKIIQAESDHYIHQLVWLCYLLGCLDEELFYSAFCSSKYPSFVQHHVLKRLVAQCASLNTGIMTEEDDIESRGRSLKLYLSFMQKLVLRVELDYPFTKELYILLLDLLKRPEEGVCDEAVHTAVLAYERNNAKVFHTFLRHPKQAEFAHTFCHLFNRQTVEEVYVFGAYLRFIRDIFQFKLGNEFFYPNDTKVIIDVLLLHLWDCSSEAAHASSLLKCLGSLLLSWEYNGGHKTSELVEALRSFMEEAQEKHQDTLVSLAEKVVRILRKHSRQQHS